jgi:hypothetical protein
MSRIIIGVMAATALLTSTGLASAQQKAHSSAYPRNHYYNYYNYTGNVPYNYYNRSYWRAFPTQPWVQQDPYAGTMWQGVVPY